MGAKKKQLSSSTNIEKVGVASCDVTARGPHLQLVTSEEATPTLSILVLELSFFFRQIQHVLLNTLSHLACMYPPALQRYSCFNSCLNAPLQLLISPLTLLCYLCQHVLIHTSYVFLYLLLSVRGVYFLCT